MSRNIDQRQSHCIELSVSQTKRNANPTIRNVPCRLPEENHLCRVSSESVNVGVHPLDSFALIEQSRVQVMSIQSTGLGETEDVEAVAGHLSEI